MDRLSSWTLGGNLHKAESILREHGKLPSGYKPPSLLDYLSRSGRSGEAGGLPTGVTGSDKVPAATQEGVKVELSRDSVEITIGPELAKSLKSADLGKLFESLYNTPQVKSALDRIGTG